MSSLGERLTTAYLWLTVAEAAELRDTLDQMLRQRDFEGHHHVSSADYGTEVTVSLARAYGAVFVRFPGANRHPVPVSSPLVTGSSWEVGHACNR